MSRNTVSWKYIKDILNITAIQVLAIFFLKIHPICAIAYGTPYPRTLLKKKK